MDFFHPWPRQALISVAARFLEDVELGDISVKESLAVHMAEEHLSVTKVGGRLYREGFFDVDVAVVCYIPMATTHIHHVLNAVDRRPYPDRAELIFWFRARSSAFGRPQKASTEYYETQRRYNYVTPKSYLELIGFYKFLLDQKRTEVQRQIDRLDVGLSTLRKTAADVAELQVDLTHTMVKV